MVPCSQAAEKESWPSQAAHTWEPLESPKPAPSPCSALQVARRAETLSPLGALYYNTGRYQEALQVYREAAALQPAQREVRLALVSAEEGELQRSRFAGGHPCQSLSPN